jgi:hypothetical protein
MSACVAWVHVNHFHTAYDQCRGDGGACCWLKTTLEQLSYDPATHYNISSGEVSGHTSNKPPAPPAPDKPPSAPAGPAGKTVYSTLLYTYEWPKTSAAGETQAKESSDNSNGNVMVAAIRVVRDLAAHKLLTASQTDAAIDLLVLSGGAGRVAEVASGLTTLLAGIEVGERDAQLVIRYLARHA